MSSGTNVLVVNQEEPSNGIQFNLSGENSNQSSDPSNYDLTGFQYVQDYHRYLELVEDLDDFPIKHVKPFLNTKNEEVLEIIGKSKFVAKKTKEAIDKVLDPWQPDAAREILKFLKHIPFELKTLVDNELGHALKSIKKAAIVHGDNEIIALCSKLISDWKELQSKVSNSNGKRDRSSVSPPGSPKKIKLAIQKDPPVRPKAMTDKKFLESLGDQKKMRRFTYGDGVLEGSSKAFESYTQSESATKSEPNDITVHSLPSVTLKRSTPFVSNTDLPYTSTTFHIPITLTPKSEVSDVSAPATSNSSASATSNSPSRKKKTVTFKANLCEVREYEKDPEEWASFDSQTPEEIENYYGPPIVASNQRPHYDIPSVPWSQPREISFNTDENSSLVIPKLMRTNEYLAQENREKLSLAAIYINHSHIPHSPGEPDEGSDPNVNTQIIPLVDINTQTNHTAPSATEYIPPQPTSIAPVTPPNYYSAEALSAMSAMVDAAMKDTTVRAALEQSIRPKQNVVNQNQQTFSPMKQPPVYKQPEVTHSAVESLLKNNPDIMNSLKELSFLAGNEDTEMSESQPELVPANLAHFAQPAFQNNGYNYSNGCNRNPSSRGSRGGRGGGRGGRLESCHFYTTKVGCKRGENCPFSHGIQQ